MLNKKRTFMCDWWMWLTAGNVTELIKSFHLTLQPRPPPTLTCHAPCMWLVWVQHEAGQLSGGSECGGQGCQWPLPSKEHVLSFGHLRNFLFYFASYWMLIRLYTPSLTMPFLRLVNISSANCEQIILVQSIWFLVKAKHWGFQQ